MRSRRSVVLARVDGEIVDQDDSDLFDDGRIAVRIMGVRVLEKPFKYFAGDYALSQCEICKQRGLIGELVEEIDAQIIYPLAIDRSYGWWCQVLSYPQLAYERILELPQVEFDH